MAVLVFLATLPVCVLGHSELVLQIEGLTSQIETDPGNAELLLKRGDLYRRHLDFSAAGQDLEAARVLEPDNPLVEFYAGRLALEMGDAAAADRFFSLYLEAYPKHSNAWVLRGEACIKLGEPARAAGYFEQGIITTGAPSPALYRSEVLSLLASGEAAWRAALEVVDKGLKHFGLEVNLLGLGTDIALAGNQADLANRYLERLPGALKTLPQWARRMQLASCLVSREDGIPAQCLLQSRDNLSTQVELFMAGGKPGK